MWAAHLRPISGVVRAGKECGSFDLSCFLWFLTGLGLIYVSFGATFAVLNSNSIILRMARLQKMNTTS